MSRPLVRRTFAAVSASALALGIAAAAPMTADAATSFQAFGGSAYGSYARLGPLLSLGASSSIGLCSSIPGIVRRSGAAALNLPESIGNVGAATTQVSSRARRSTSSSVTTTTTGAVSLLDGPAPGFNGLVTADAITAMATSTKTSTGFTTSGNASFVDLRIAGVPIQAKPGANSKVVIPGIAEVFLNKQTVVTPDHAINVDALRINLLPGNTLGLPSGLIIVGNARSSIKSVSSMAYGNAYGTQIDVSGVVKSGRTAAVGLPCGGSGGTVRSNNVAGLNLHNVLSTGVAKTAAASFQTSTNNKTVTMAVVSGVTVLDDVITAQAVTSKASADRRGSTVSTSSIGSSIVGLKINGRTFTGIVRENTRVSIAGVGTLTLNQVIKTSTGIEVRAISLTLDTKVGNTVKGTTINVAVAEAGVDAR